ncbi:uncharacterized protein LOC125236180 [Leguminivora glycinivorella]|uniref:uncharacterized protein LOC125236180 n=1 Tax=Leguminivora glycinivorella TaxID=1035111 RepID=UPI00200C9085|nr:uncharacterized protein LOC125236180 [Leguminivora glycinivorella]
MQIPYLFILLFTLLVNLLYCICQEDKINDWVNSNNCQPGSPIELDFCTCQCSEVTAAIRSSPELQLEASRRLQLRRSQRQKRQTYTTKPYTPGVPENPPGVPKDPPEAPGEPPGVIKCWETCVDTLI